MSVVYHILRRHNIQQEILDFRDLLTHSLAQTTFKSQIEGGACMVLGVEGIGFISTRKDAQENILSLLPKDKNAKEKEK